MSTSSCPSRLPPPSALPPVLHAWASFGIQLQDSAANVVGLSIPLSGTFYGFSIEMSVATQAWTQKDPQTEVAQYLVAQAAGKPFVMSEMNTASCGGFSGLSDSFGAALWALDYGLQMGYSNFSHAPLHPSTPPPTNQSSFHQWTTGPIFYSVLAVAETLGTTGATQLIDLGANGGNDYTPGYAEYEGGSLARVALFNYMTDPSGASGYIAKYLVAPSVGEKFNITWGRQTFGPVFSSDGRLQGTETMQTGSCDQGAGTCTVTVPVPGFALVSFTSTGLNWLSSTATFATTVATQQHCNGELIRACDVERALGREPMLSMVMEDMNDYILDEFLNNLNSIVPECSQYDQVIQKC
ncbi:hypothetical protein B0H21DRAFT_858786 [Amylocystis lapponica]|nr:hypothetical protein B0H21DRAFT_858786 [Amylocystis lapponica]